jgi:hypothetical protein
VGEIAVGGMGTGIKIVGNWDGGRKRNAVIFYVQNCNEKSCKRTLCAQRAYNAK